MSRAFTTSLGVLVAVAAFGQSAVARMSASEVREAQQKAALARAEPAKSAVPFEDGLPVVKVTSANNPLNPVPGGVRWFGRDHQNNLQKTKEANFDLVFLGDSITQGWPGDLFQKYFGKYKPTNFGIGGDRAENVLWRLNNGELDGTSPKLIVLLLGVCNSGMNTSEEIALGVANVVKTLRTKLPNTKILILGILPNADDEKRAKTEEANRILAGLDSKKSIRYFNGVGPKFMDNDGKLRNDVLTDGVHLTRNGYVIWGETIAPVVAEMMKN